MSLSFQGIEALIQTEDQHLNCYGMIILRKGESGLETLLVQSRKGHWGFPKGKRKFKKGETELQAAFREVEEETGYPSDSFQFLLDEDGRPEWLVEMSLKGNKSIGLLVATPQDPHREVVYDPEELQAVTWHPVEEALKYPEEQLYSKRKAVLQSAVEKCMGW